MDYAVHIEAGGSGRFEGFGEDDDYSESDDYSEDNNDEENVEYHNSDLWLFGLQVTFFVSCIVLVTIIIYTVANASGIRSRPSMVPLSYESDLANDTTGMALFWRNYRTIMTATEDYEDWFTDVDEATHAIQTMFVVIPPLAPDEGKMYGHMRELVESRARHVKLAYAEWNRFMNIRDRAVRDVNSGGLSRVYVDGEPVDQIINEIRSNWVPVAWGFEAAFRTSFPLSPGNETVIGEEIIAGIKAGKKSGTSDHIDEESLAALAITAHRITQELVRTHAGLFRDWDPAHLHIRQALIDENELIDTLCKVSSKGEIWTRQLDNALPLLVARMKTLQAKHENMSTVLGWLQKQFPKNKPEKMEDQAAWLVGVKELLQAWASTLMDVQEGVLYMLRRRDIRSNVPRLYPQVSWGAWKSRNCGGTSCFNAPSAVGSLITRFRAGNPVARVAEDEVRWHRGFEGDPTPMIWRGVYEKACCETGMFAYQLQNIINER
ncbi:hypothetical protein E0Z10_g1526 [Xylaria hypoxylon]|uniref:Uncharacterized protein n=1 Tax=Xylaria hypoxylon TaxID=37992 RepID=A0A4Z0YT70_9PEZI|nr:hypothetical protein E0Z10_g1526 [Xylaria hypoxylon]